MRDKLARRVRGEDTGGPAGYVRYHGFTEREDREGVKTRSARRHSVSGPHSGHLYTFQEKDGGQTQWIACHNSADFELFESDSDYETTRSEP